MDERRDPTGFGRMRPDVPSPRFSGAGRVEWIGIRPGRDRPVEALGEARAVSGRGLAGDHAIRRSGGRRQVDPIAVGTSSHYWRPSAARAETRLVAPQPRGVRDRSSDSGWTAVSGRRGVARGNGRLPAMPRYGRGAGGWRARRDDGNGRRDGPRGGGRLDSSGRFGRPL